MTAGRGSPRPEGPSSPGQAPPRRDRPHSSHHPTRMRPCSGARLSIPPIRCTSSTSNLTRHVPGSFGSRARRNLPCPPSANPLACSPSCPRRSPARASCDTHSGRHPEPTQTPSQIHRSAIHPVIHPPPRDLANRLSFFLDVAISRAHVCPPRPCPPQPPPVAPFRHQKKYRIPE